MLAALAALIALSAYFSATETALSLIHISIEKKEEALAAKHAAADKENEEIQIIKRSQTEDVYKRQQWCRRCRS